MPKSKDFHKIKKLSPLRVIIYSVISLGIYAFIWISRRYREQAKTVSKFSHWLFAMALIMMSFMLMIGLSMFSLLSISDIDAAVYIYTYGSYLILFVMVVAVTWWSVHYITKIKETSDKATPKWAVVLMAFFFMPIAVAYKQYRINGGNSQLSFAWPTSIATALGIVILAISFVVYPIDHNISTIKMEFLQFRQELKGVDALSQEYQTCIDKLDVDYPEDIIGSDKYDQYMNAFNKCDEIYKKIQEL